MLFCWWAKNPFASLLIEFVKTVFAATLPSISNKGLPSIICIPPLTCALAICLTSIPTFHQLYSIPNWPFLSQQAENVSWPFINPSFELFASGVLDLISSSLSRVKDLALMYKDKYVNLGSIKAPHRTFGEHRIAKGWHLALKHKNSQALLINLISHFASKDG